MKGFFHKDTKFSRTLIICGLILVSILIFIGFLSPPEDNWFYFAFTIPALALGSGLLFEMYNYRAFLSVDEEKLSARYAWGKRLSISTADILFAKPGINTVSLLLKDGHSHNIMGLVNSWDICEYIRETNYAPETEAPETLRKEYEDEKAQRRKYFPHIIVSIVLMFLYIIVVLILTGGKDTGEFSKAEETLFLCMIAAEIITIIFGLYFSVKSGKHLLPMNYLEYRLCSALIISAPLPAGLAKEVYTDHNCTRRFVIMGLPKSDELYCCVQEINQDFELETVYTSRFGELPDDMFLINISRYFAVG